VLADLSASLPRLDGADGRRARALLSRPTDPNDQFGDSYSPAALATADFDCTANFCVHWVEIGQHAPDLADTSPANGVPDYVDDVQAEAEISYQVENVDLAWTEPVPDGALGGESNKTDVYLFNVGDLGFFGYASWDPGQGSGHEKYGYVVVDNDYAEDFGLPPLDAMKVTMAHEYNHILQFAYDLKVQGWMFESTATWVEDLVYPDINDYLNYVPGFANNPQIPLTHNGGGGNKIYGAAMWNHFIAEAGANLVREAWEFAPNADPAHFAVGAYDNALGGSGSNPFGGIAYWFVEFAADSAEWRANASAYADHAELPNVKRSGTLRAGGKAVKFRLDHLAYRLLNVPVKPHLRLKVVAPDGTRTGFDLVGRTGDADDGSVDKNPQVDPSGGTATQTLAAGVDPFDRITAVIVNADPRLNASGKYKRDNQLYKAKVVKVSP
jgi:hypothetical protein